MKTSDFYYDLPEELIAQDPLTDRSSSRLMILDKETGDIRHKIFKDIIDELNPELVLQDVDVWYDSTKIPTTPHNNMTELYFEDNDIEGIIKKLESGKYVVSYVTELMELEGGQKLVRFYDPSGNLIEVRTPINYN